MAIRLTGFNEGIKSYQAEQANQAELSLAKQRQAESERQAQVTEKLQRERFEFDKAQKLKETEYTEFTDGMAQVAQKGKTLTAGGSSYRLNPTEARHATKWTGFNTNEIYLDTDGILKFRDADNPDVAMNYDRQLGELVKEEKLDSGWMLFTAVEGGTYNIGGFDDEKGVTVEAGQPIYVRTPDGTNIPYDQLTPEQKIEMAKFAGDAKDFKPGTGTGKRSVQTAGQLAAAGRKVVTQIAQMGVDIEAGPGGMSPDATERTIDDRLGLLKEERAAKMAELVNIAAKSYGADVIKAAEGEPELKAEIDALDKERNELSVWRGKLPTYQKERQAAQAEYEGYLTMIDPSTDQYYTAGDAAAFTGISTMQRRINKLEEAAGRDFPAQATKDWIDEYWSDIEGYDTVVNGEQVSVPGVTPTEALRKMLLKLKEFEDKWAAMQGGK